MNKPLFSVVVPAYNSESFLSKCVDSVLNQTCDDFELVLVDDGSKDSTLQICRAYAKTDPRVVVVHKENGGHTSARNEGLKTSIGEYVVFLDSDDWLNPETLMLCKQEICIHNPDIIIFRLKNSDSNIPFPVLVEDGYYTVDDMNELFLDRLIMGSDGSHVFPKSLSGKCFRRDIILSRQLSIPKQILIGEDGAAFLGAMLDSKEVSVIAGDERACYNSLVRLGSVSRSPDSNALKNVIVLLKYFETLFSRDDYFFDQQLDRICVSQIYAALLFSIRSGMNRKDLNVALDRILLETKFLIALKNARFSLRGYKLIIKKYILRYRLWGIAKMIDR